VVSIVEKRGNWTMEDYLHWTESNCTYILKPDDRGRPILPECVAEMWAKLRNSILYFTRCDPLPGVPSKLEDAKKYLWEYSKMVEEHMSHDMCTFQLHVMNCRIPSQEAASGRVCFNTEYWVEREVQWAKRVLGSRIKKDTELVLGNAALLEEATRKCWSAEYDIRSFDEWVPEYRSGEHRGRNLDQGDQQFGEWEGSG
jgi:hypothetical protein